MWQRIIVLVLATFSFLFLFFFILHVWPYKFSTQHVNLFFFQIWSFFYFFLFKIIHKIRICFRFHHPLIFLLVKCGLNFFDCWFFLSFFNCIYFSIASLDVLFNFYVKFDLYFFNCYLFYFGSCFCWNFISHPIPWYHVHWDFANWNFSFMILYGLLFFRIISVLELGL